MNRKVLWPGAALRLMALGGALAAAVVQAQPSGQPRAEQDTGRLAAVELTFEEHEPGQEAGLVRVLVTADHLRMDDGTASEDFVLLDRKARVLFSTDSVRRNVLTVAYREWKAEPPIPLEIEDGKETMGDAPRVGGRAPVHRYLLANGTRCYDTVSVPGLLEDAAAALGEMREILASEHARVLGSIPADVHEACDLAINLFAADWPMRAGLPLREWNARGYRRVLTGYREEAAVQPALFVLPAGYGRFVVGEGR